MVTNLKIFPQSMEKLVFIFPVHREFFYCPSLPIWLLDFFLKIKKKYILAVLDENDKIFFIS